VERGEVLNNRNFIVFWAAQALSELGNGFALVAMPLLVLDATGSVAQMGLLTGVAGVASIVTGLFAGVLADRLDRRRLMLTCDAARAVLFGLVPLGWAFGSQVWLLYAVTGLAAVFDMVFRVTYVAAIPNLVPREHIITANSRLQSTNSLAYITGPMLAGVVAALLGPTAAIGVNAASFGVSVAGLAVTRLRHTAGDRMREPGGFLTGLGFLWRTPVLRALTVLLSVVTFVSLGLNDVFIYLVRHELGRGEQVVGYVLGVAGLGTVVAAALTPMLRRRLGFGACWLGSYVLCGLALAALSRSGNVVGVTALILAYSFGMAVAGICSMTLRQQVTPDQVLGRVTSAFWTIHSALAPAGAAVLTAVVGRFGVRGPLLAVGGILLAVVLAGSFTPIRQRTPESRSRANGPAAPGPAGTPPRSGVPGTRPTPRARRTAR
jgi:MFS family permease